MNDWVGQRAWTVKSARHSPDSRVAGRVVALIATSSTTGCRLVMTAPPSKPIAWHEGPRTLCTASKAAPIMGRVAAVPLAALTGLSCLMKDLTDGAAPTSVMTSALGVLGFCLSASKGFDNVERFRNLRRVRRGHASGPARGYGIAELVRSEADRQTISERPFREIRNAAACYGLGVSYEARLLGFEVDEARSQVYLTMACELGHALACKSESP